MKRKKLKTSVYSAKKTHLLQQQSSMNVSHMADVALFLLLYTGLHRSLYYLYKVCARVRRSSSDSYLFCTEKSLLCMRNDRTLHSQQEDILSLMYSVHIATKNWFISLTVRAMAHNGSLRAAASPSIPGTFHVLRAAYFTLLKMEVTGSFEVSVTSRQAVGRHTSDDWNPCSHRREKLKCETEPVLHMRFFPPVFF